MNDSLFVITISRQFGSGGSFLGHRLAQHLNILFLDREILNQAAQELKISEAELDSRDEKVTPVWQSLLQSMECVFTTAYTPPPLDIPTDDALYKTEADIITRAVLKNSAVVVGRAGCYVLRQHPKHLSIFLHANIDFRKKRVQEIYKVSEQNAINLINRIDLERSHYLRVVTGQDFRNACQYHLCLDTSAVGLDRAEEIILATLKARLANSI
jgi:cytidylate kinase